MLVDADLADVRGDPEYHQPTDYRASQAYGVRLRNGRAESGIVFDSVRRAGGTNLCLLWPSRVPLPVIQAGHFQYQWDAAGIPTVSQLTILN